MEKIQLTLIGILVILAYVQAQSTTTTEEPEPTTAPPPLSACNLPAESGGCRALIRVYHFDMKTGKCNQFVYGGCGGNKNQFDTKEDCEAFAKRCKEASG